MRNHHSSLSRILCATITVLSLVYYVSHILCLSYIMSLVYYAQPSQFSLSYIMSLIYYVSHILCLSYIMSLAYYVSRILSLPYIMSLVYYAQPSQFSLSYILSLVYAQPPCEYELPGGLKGWRSQRLCTQVPDSLLTRLEKVSARGGAGIPTVLLSAFMITLCKHARQEEVVVGVPFQGVDDHSFLDSIFISREKKFAGM